MVIISTSSFFGSTFIFIVWERAEILSVSFFAFKKIISLELYEGTEIITSFYFWVNYSSKGVNAAYVEYVVVI